MLQDLEQKEDVVIRMKLEDVTRLGTERRCGY